MKKFILFCFLFVFSVSLFSVTFSHQKISTFNIGDKLNFQVQLDESVKVALVFYKVGENTQYQVRKMEEEQDVTFSYELDSRILTNRNLKYHFVVLKAGEYIRYPEETEIPSVGKGKLVKLPVKKKAVKIPVTLSGNYQGKWLVDYDKKGSTEKFADSGNLSVSGNFSGQKYNLTFSTTGNYTPNKTSSDDFNVSSVALNYKRGNHNLKVGDVSFTSPSLALASYGKRGMFYDFSNKKFGVKLFTLSSQQISGFGLPKKNSLITGGIVNVKLGPAKIFSMLMTGKDDPTVGQNSSYSFNTVREGSIMAIGFDATLFNYLLTAKGAYYSSNYTGDIETKDKETDHAIDTSLSLSHKTLSVSASYQEIGANYNTVGTSYLSNNQRKLNSSLSYTFLNSKVSFSSSYSYLENNVESNTSSPNSSTGNLNASLNLNFGKFKIGTGIQYNNQETDVSSGSGIASEIESTQYTLNLGYSTTPFSLSVNGGKSFNSSTVDKESYSFGANMSIYLGNVFTFSPSATYLRTDQSGQISESITSYLNYKIVIYPKLFSISGSGSYQKSETPGGVYDTESISLSTRLSLMLGWVWKQLQSSSFYVEGTYLENTYSGSTTDNYKIFGCIIISF